VSPFADPMCGSGTVAIEAALIAAGVPPGRGRRFAFQEWPSFAPGTWASVAAEPPIRAVPPVVAADRDRDAAASAAANAERAGAAAWIDVRHAPMSSFEPPSGGPGYLVTNPPYGKRASPQRDLRDLYAALGGLVRDRLPGWQVAMLVADVRLARHTGLPLHERVHTDNGGIDVRVLSTSPGTERRERQRTA
jgi:putative N6-adenine-specific DNA methylase